MVKLCSLALLLATSTWARSLVFVYQDPGTNPVPELLCDGACLTELQATDPYLVGNERITAVSDLTTATPDAKSASSAGVSVRGRSLIYRVVRVVVIVAAVAGILCALLLYFVLRTLEADLLGAFLFFALGEKLPFLAMFARRHADDDYRAPRTPFLWFLGWLFALVLVVLSSSSHRSSKRHGDVLHLGPVERFLKTGFKAVDAFATRHGKALTLSLAVLLLLFSGFALFEAHDLLVRVIDLLRAIMSGAAALLVFILVRRFFDSHTPTRVVPRVAMGCLQTD